MSKSRGLETTALTYRERITNVKCLVLELFCSSLSGPLAPKLVDRWSKGKVGCYSDMSKRTVMLFSLQSFSVSSQLNSSNHFANNKVAGYFHETVRNSCTCQVAKNQQQAPAK